MARYRATHEKHKAIDYSRSIVRLENSHGRATKVPALARGQTPPFFWLEVHGPSSGRKRPVLRRRVGAPKDSADPLGFSRKVPQNVFT